MRYVFKSATGLFETDITRSGDEINLKWDGKEKKTTVKAIGDGASFIINDNGRVLTGWAIRQKNRVFVSLLGKVIVLDDVTKDDDAVSEAAGGGSVENVVSPMPGSVIKVLVKPGQEVKKNQTLVIVEAMKMENEVRAPNDAVVNKVLVEPGKQVDSGQVLVTFAQPAEEQ